MSDWVPQPTADGSFTFYSQAFGETFHSLQGAKAEALGKFVQATRVMQKASQPTLRLLDVCYGLGYNTAAALEAIWSVNPACQVEWVGLELDATVPQAAMKPPLIDLWTPAIQQILQQLARIHHCETPRLTARLLIGDARLTIQSLVGNGFQADAIFFDPFSPRHCPHLWTVDFFRQVAACLHPMGRLATYSRSAAVRSAMQTVGLAIASLPPLDNHPPHEWSQGTIASFLPDDLPSLSLMEQEHLQTRAAVPYRDPSLTDDAATILARHQAEQQQCGLESTSSWRRRWGIQ